MCLGRKPRKQLSGKVNLKPEAMNRNSQRVPGQSTSVLASSMSTGHKLESLGKRVGLRGRLSKVCLRASP